MKITIIGTIEKIGDVQTFRNGFMKRVLTVYEDGSAARPLAVDVTGDRLKILDGFAEGDSVEIGAILSGRHWQDRIFLTIGALSMKRAAATADHSATAARVENPASVPPAPPVASPSRDADSITDSLPF